MCSDHAARSRPHEGGPRVRHHPHRILGLPRPALPPARAPGPAGTPDRERPRDARLTAAEEHTLAEAVARGDADARDRFIRANLKLVSSIARTTCGRASTSDDLIGEGNLGLIRAVEEFDPALRDPLQHLRQLLDQDGDPRRADQQPSTIRLPAHIVKLMAKWRKVERQLCREFGFAPTAEQVAVALGLTDSQREMIEQARRARGMQMEAGARARTAGPGRPTSSPTGTGAGERSRPTTSVRS